MQAFDFVFRSPEGMFGYNWFPGKSTVETPTGNPWGWIGSAGPGIEAATWPRGTLTGLPMFHAFTLWLPAEYRRHGDNYPAIAFFQGEGQFAQANNLPDDHPYRLEWAQAQPHPQLNLRTDIIEGEFALLWLTAEEYAVGPAAPPPDNRGADWDQADDEGPNAWDTVKETLWFWLVERADPNTGLAPTEATDTAYAGMWDAVNKQVRPWVEPLYGRCHLGGTCLPVQGMPEGLTPYYIEIEELPGLNFGGGSAQIDLESDTFDWAC